MDVCSQISLSVTDDVNDLHGLCMNTLEPTHGITEDYSVDELGNGVNEFLNIQNDKEEVPGSIPPYTSEFQKKDVSGDSHQISKTTGAPEKSLSRFATFPCSIKTLSSLVTGGTPEGDIKDGVDSITRELSPHGDNIISTNPHCSRSLSLPTQLKQPVKQPVSAMKGSREKRGVTPPVKLTVKWAPDVYDPIPTSVSHVVTNNRPSKHSRKNSKSKQKHTSKSSRGSKGKDKKQVRRRGGNSSNTAFKLPEHEEVVDFCEAQPGALDFHVGNPDQFCGSSFLKRYGASLHLSSVAEAT